MENKELTIGNITLQSPFIAAPMAGVSDGAYRGILTFMGAALTCTEMVSAKGLLYNNKKTKDLLYIDDEENLVSYQIFGCEPEIMGKAAESLRDYKNTFLDMNMGCPVPKVVKNGEGSALLKDLDKLFDVVEATVKKAGKPVTVKMRTGWDQGHIVACEAAMAAQDAGASAVCIHGRTREQFYEGKADWDIIAKVKNAVSIPVVGNGDIFSARDAMAMMKETACDFVLIGRGMLGNPWIFRECNALWKDGSELPPPTKEEKQKMILHHLHKLSELKGERVAVREMRKHFAWYTKGLPGAAEKRRLANDITDLAGLEELIGKL